MSRAFTEEDEDAPSPRSGALAAGGGAATVERAAVEGGRCPRR